jgi:hypothetical protein
MRFGYQQADSMALGSHRTLPSEDEQKAPPSWLRIRPSEVLTRPSLQLFFNFSQSKYLLVSIVKN